MRKKLILFTAPTLGAIGAQRVLVTILKYWNSDKYDVKILVVSADGALREEVPKQFEIIEADKYVSNIPKIKVLEILLYGFFRAIKELKPDLILSIAPFTNYACFIPKFFFGMNYKLLVSEHGHVSTVLKDKEHMKNLFNKFYKLTFKKVYNSSAIDGIICIANESRNDLIENHQIIKEKTSLIFNPTDYKMIQKLATEPIDQDWLNSDDKFVIISAGRLSKQKRQDILIRSFSDVRSRHDNVRLIILGAGDQTYLRNLINEENLEDDILLAGFHVNPWKWVAKSNLFVLTSFWEGLPCVLAETMALGVPIVSTDCPSGPKEMLNNGKFGLLAATDNLIDITEKIEYAMTNYLDMKLNASKALEVIDRYDPTKIALKYFDLVERTL